MTGDLTIRGITPKVALNVHYLGQWPTPWWEDGVDKGRKILLPIEEALSSATLCKSRLMQRLFATTLCITNNIAVSSSSALGKTETNTRHALFRSSSVGQTVG